MAKQTFTTGQVLTAAQMTSLQQTAMGGGSATAKTANYTLVAADAGATVIMNSASATTITVNTSLFSAGDTVFLQNIGAGVCTITAGTATVNTASSLALAQYESGNLYFTAAGTSIFSKADGAAAGGGGKVLQAISAQFTAPISTTSGAGISGWTDVSTLSATITPTLNTSKILFLAQISTATIATGSLHRVYLRIVRDSTAIGVGDASTGLECSAGLEVATAYSAINNMLMWYDNPATTSATTYKIQVVSDGASQTLKVNSSSNSTDSSSSSTASQIMLLEIGA